MVSVKRVGIMSAMKVGALLYALLFTVFGLFFLGLQSLALNAFANLVSSQSPRSNIPTGGVLAGGLAAFCIFYIVGVIFAAISGGIGGAVTAFFYNIVANWVGGVEIELSSGGDKPKREVLVGQPPNTGF